MIQHVAVLICWGVIAYKGLIRIKGSAQIMKALYVLCVLFAGVSLYDYTRSLINLNFINKPLMWYYKDIAQVTIMLVFMFVVKNGVPTNGDR